MVYLLFTFYCCHRPSPWAPEGFFFSRGGHIIGLGTSPQRGPGMEPRWGSRDESPRETDYGLWK